MIRIDKEAVINAPLQKVFDYAKDPSNWLEIWPSLLRLEEKKELAGGGYSAKHEYKMAGMRFKGTGEFTEYIPNRWFVVRTYGNTQSTITCTFRKVEDSTREKTRVTVTIEYVIPIPLLGKLAEFVVMKMNDQEADLVLANLQARMLTVN